MPQESGIHRVEGVSGVKTEGRYGARPTDYTSRVERNTPMIYVLSHVAIILVYLSQVKQALPATPGWGW